MTQTSKHLSAISLIAGLFVCQINAQVVGDCTPSVDANNRLRLEERMDAPGTSKAELYGRLLGWAALLKDGLSSVQLSDTTVGQFVLRNSMVWEGSKPSLRCLYGGFTYRLSVSFKHGAWKYVVDDVMHQPLDVNGCEGAGNYLHMDMLPKPRIAYNEITRQVLQCTADEKMRELAQSLKTAMASKAQPISTDW